GEALGVDYLALAKDPGLERHDALPDDLDGAVRADLGGGDAVGADVQADDRVGLGGREKCHWESPRALRAHSSIGSGTQILGRCGVGYASGKNSSKYQSTMSSPNHRPTTPPSARNGPNGMACLRAAAPRRAMIATPTTAPTAKPISTAGATARPRNRPIIATSFASPMPMPRG